MLSSLQGIYTYLLGLCRKLADFTRDVFGKLAKLKEMGQGAGGRKDLQRIGSLFSSSVAGVAPNSATEGTRL